MFRQVWLAGHVRVGKFGIPVGFALTAAPVFLIIGLLVVRAEQDGATSALIRATEVQNAGIARTLANAHADTINYFLAFDVGDAPEILPIALRRSGLEPLISTAVQDTNVINVKLYDGKGITLLSLDRTYLGEDVSACECFAHVLKVGSFSELILFDDAHHAPGTGSHVGVDTDILSTMIRLNVLTDDLVASDSVLEIQSDVTPLLAMVAATRQGVIFTVGAPLLALYLAMVALVAFGHFTILKRERHAAQFAARAAESEASDRAKSEFLSMMSHELRTPLNAIIGFSQLIGQNIKGDQDEEMIDYANTIHDSGQHMLKMVSSILDMTALELGELDLDHNVLHLEDVVRAAVQDAGPAFDRNLVTLNVQDSANQAPVLGDREKLRQVFDGLLSNAARFTPAGGTVDVVFDTEPGGFVCVCIKDTGVGMTKEQIDRARVPFQANWIGYSREFDGAGLGLTIADKVISNLGGALEIKSEADVGTTIIVRLPACPADRENVTELSARRDAVSKTGTQQRQNIA
ncbi:MAG: HAMP domain-containing sensor histidine kinase [Proteobacteria bacterium]|nr:HAMP domain-containing sensor histidine kinase [Pseudomonadota bacterium]